MTITLEQDVYPRLIDAYNRSPGKAAYSVLTATVWPEYRPKSGFNLDIEGMRRFNALLAGGIQNGMFSSKLDPKEGVYKSITATDTQIRAMAKVLGVELKPDFLLAMRAVLERYQHSPCPQVAAWASLRLAQSGGELLPRGWFPFNGRNTADCAESLSTLLRGCESACALREDVLQRVFSVQHFNGSKDFKNNYSHKLAAVMEPELAADGVSDQDILQKLHILQNPASVWLRGDARMIFQNGDALTCAAYPSGMALTRDCVAQVRHIRTGCILTVENLTTFQDLTPPPDSLVVFTSGYANGLVVTLLQKVIQDNRLSSTLHFGDLDAFGFHILRNLSARLGVPVTPCAMDRETYLRHKGDSVEMTPGNRSMFQRLLRDPYFGPTEREFFLFLLGENRTLEQESIRELPCPFPPARK